jgi:hypothetical protein
MKTLFRTLSLICISLLLFSCQPENTHIDLTANRWQLLKFKDSNQASFRKAKADYFLEFTSDSLLNISLDVNDCWLRYASPETGEIEMEEGLLCTKVCCDTDYAEAFGQTLLEMKSYYGQGDKLIFEGEGEIVFVPE